MSPCANGTGVCTSPSAPYPGYVLPLGALRHGSGVSAEEYVSLVEPHLGEAEGGWALRCPWDSALSSFWNCLPSLFSLVLSTKQGSRPGQPGPSPCYIHLAHAPHKYIHSASSPPLWGLTVLCNSVPFYYAHFQIIHKNRIIQ